MDITINPTIAVWLVAVSGFVGPYVTALLNRPHFTTTAKLWISIAVSVVLTFLTIIVFTLDQVSQGTGTWPEGFHNWLVYVIIAVIATQAFYKTVFKGSSSDLEVLTTPYKSESDRTTDDSGNPIDAKG